MKLYTYFRSQASFRVRIALNLKGIAREDSFLHLEKGDQFAAAYRAINPQMVVPTLIDGDIKLFQSLAILEYLDEAYPCPDVIPVHANHQLYTEYHERVLAAVDTCLPVEKVCSIDEMACRLLATERQLPVARELALKVKGALREQVGECLTCSIGIAPNVFLGKVGSDLQKPDGLVVITKVQIPDILLGLELQDIYGIGRRMEE